MLKFGIYRIHLHWSDQNVVALHIWLLKQDFVLNEDELEKNSFCKEHDDEGNNNDDNSEDPSFLVKFQVLD